MLKLRLNPATLFTAAAMVAATAVAAQSASSTGRLKIQKPAHSLGLKAPSSGPVKDEHCGPGHVPCDDIFKKYCAKVLGGTMSGPQGWGGQTCFEPS